MHILIVGSGIAGPTLACWISHNLENSITVLEKSPSLLLYGQNVDISGSAVTCIKKMGLMPQVKHCNTKELGTRFIDSYGKPFAPFPIKEGSSASLTSEYEILDADCCNYPARLFSGRPIRSTGQSNVRVLVSCTGDECVNPFCSLCSSERWLLRYS